MNWKNLSEAKSYNQLCRTKNLMEPSLALTAARIKSCSISAGGGIQFHYAASLVSSEILETLQKLADEQQLVEKYEALVSGERINTGENRRVLHHLLRGEFTKPVIEDGQNIGDFYREQNRRVREFAGKIHSGAIRGSTGKAFDTVVQIGIGGSELGPHALCHALDGAAAARMRFHFVSNVDPNDAADCVRQINPETTLFILVSKSGTTQETLSNHALILALIEKSGITDFNADKHTVAVTSKTSPLASATNILDSFYIDDYVGGRYSATSPVGGLVISLAFGPDVFDEILSGANEADKHAMERDITQNAALMDALIGVYYRNVLNLASTAVLPYSQALARFPAHLQQLDMESNGKSVNRFGKPVDYSTGPVVFGEPGTNGQHSFYQLLHQGTDIIPLQFVGFRQSRTGIDSVIDGSTNQIKLNANLAAQIIAFAKGRNHENANKSFAGRRPNTLLAADRLSTPSLGALLAHFENKVMFQGFCWNINSFDQEGVQLGKILTQSVLDGSSSDEALKTYAEILGIK